jgi:hypothetical protein
MLTLETMTYHLSYEMGQMGIFGAVFGIFYSMFYATIPGKGVKKSFIFGSIMFLFANLFEASATFLLGLLTGIEQYFWFSFTWALAISNWAVYGIFLGIFYERWK